MLELFEVHGLWPVGLVLTRTQGVTLWGTGGAADEIDRVLGEAGDLVLLPGREDLEDFVVRTGSPSGPGYEGLRELVRNGTARLDPVVTFDYPELLRALRQPSDRWDLPSFAGLLDAINMLDDIAVTLHDPIMRGLLGRPTCTALLDRLTFLTEEQVAGDSATLDTEALRAVVEECVERAERRVVPGFRTAPVPRGPGGLRGPG